jgi:hypothetical protein
MAHFGEQCEMGYQRKRALKIAVLGHLRLSSPKQWDMLCIHFTMDRDEEIETILKDLRHKRYIEVGKGKMVRITASGRQHLEEQFYLSGGA